MHKLLIFLTLFIVLLQQKNASAQPFKKLVWSDEFNYKGLPDAKKWSYDTGGHGWGNNELQYYTANKSKNARVENGNLIIEAHKETVGKNLYSSARLVSKGRGDWKFGRIDIKAKIPSGLGTWPAIWMLGSTTPLKWPDDGEIDIMEHVGYDQGNIHASVHTKKYNHIQRTQKTDSVFVKDCSTAFHIYSVEWNAEHLTVLLDNQVYFHFNNNHTGYDAWPFNNPMHLLLNVAVGGFWGGLKGVNSSIFPKKMEIDYIRVYQ
jgi:beta-glucanase (GH16 family)